MSSSAHVVFHKGRRHHAVKKRSDDAAEMKVFGNEKGGVRAGEKDDDLQHFRVLEEHVLEQQGMQAFKRKKVKRLWAHISEQSSVSYAKKKEIC